MKLCASPIEQHSLIRLTPKCGGKNAEAAMGANPGEFTARMGVDVARRGKIY